MAYDFAVSPVHARYRAYRSEISARSLSERLFRYSASLQANRAARNSDPARVYLPSRAYSSASIDVVLMYAEQRETLACKQASKAIIAYRSSARQYSVGDLVEAAGFGFDEAHGCVFPDYSQGFLQQAGTACGSVARKMMKCRSNYPSVDPV